MNSASDVGKPAEAGCRPRWWVLQHTHAPIVACLQQAFRGASGWFRRPDRHGRGWQLQAPWRPHSGVARRDTQCSQVRLALFRRIVLHRPGRATRPAPRQEPMGAGRCGPAGLPETATIPGRCTVETPSHRARASSTPGSGVLRPRGPIQWQADSAILRLTKRTISRTIWRGGSHDGTQSQ